MNFMDFSGLVTVAAFFIVPLVFFIMLLAVAKRYRNVGPNQARDGSTRFAHRSWSRRDGLPHPQRQRWSYLPAGDAEAARRKAMADAEAIKAMATSEADVGRDREASQSVCREIRGASINAPP